MKRFWLLTVISALVIALLIGLGTWQLQRLAWKQDLIATLQARLHTPPRPLAEVMRAKSAGQDIAFARVALSGQFVDLPPLRLHAVRQGVMGTQLFSPFLDASAHVVFVDIGFTPFPDQIQIPKGPRRVVARVRLPEARGLRPANDGAKNRWYWRDMAAMNADFGPSGVPFTLEAERPMLAGVTPHPVTPDSLTNRHLGYALTWYSFAVIWVVIYVLLVRRMRGAQRLSQS